MIYLASPYTSHSNNEMEQRYRNAVEAVALLTQTGLVVYSPIVHYHVPACLYAMPRDIEFWWHHSQQMIDLAEGVYVLECPGHAESFGVAREVQYAEGEGKPIRRLCWEDRSAWPK